MTQLVTLTRKDQVGLITIDNPPVNALSHPVRLALLELLGAAARDPELSALVIACAGRTFVAGADIKEFGKTPLAPDLPEVVEFLDTVDKPVIAALHGTALGGGLELALACHYRLAAPGTKLGLPEVTLGILPGAGGTQRLPRLIGVRAALELIVGGALIGVARAQALGLVDALAEGDLVESALAFANRVVAEGAKVPRISARTAVVEDPDEFERCKRETEERRRGFLAPLHCIEAVRAAVELPFSEGLERERALFRELMSSPQSRAQRHVFFGEREAAKPAGLPRDTAPAEVRSIAALGSVSDAAAAAERFARANVPASLVDPSSTLAELKDADLVLDLTFGDLARKRELFARLDAACHPGALLATSSPELDLDELAASTRRPEAVVGLHFVSPERGRVVEVARGRKTSPQACAAALKLGKALGKVCVLVSARPGGVGERLFRRFAEEAARLVAEGAPAEQVERVLQDFGFPKDELARAGLATNGQPATNGAAGERISDREILERCVFSLVNESARLLDEQVAARPVEIDVICVLGYGFPAYRGGPLFYADEVGAKAVLELVEQYRAAVGGDAWAPAASLERLAATGGRFYPGG